MITSDAKPFDDGFERDRRERHETVCRVIKESLFYKDFVEKIQSSRYPNATFNNIHRVFLEIRALL